MNHTVLIFITIDSIYLWYLYMGIYSNMLHCVAITMYISYDIFMHFKMFEKAIIL